MKTTDYQIRALCCLPAYARILKNHTKTGAKIELSKNAAAYFTQTAAPLAMHFCKESLDFDDLQNTRIINACNWYLYDNLHDIDFLTALRKFTQYLKDFVDLHDFWKIGATDIPRVPLNIENSLLTQSKMTAKDMERCYELERTIKIETLSDVETDVYFEGISNYALKPHFHTTLNFLENANKTRK